ncbi:MAG: DUF308 domain-containing protein [Oscillospiraceae bacterium]|nr:DUF308 domain-containing protein [Oscillospiraceae bacterium]
MVTASIIIGILLIVCGVSCMAAPVDTFLRAAHLLAILLFAYGIFGIVRFFKRRALVPELVVSILAVAIGFVYLFRPGGTPPVGNLIGLDRFVLTLVALWFLVKGWIYLSASVRTRFLNRKWIWGFLVGLLSILIGVYALTQPVFAAATTGTLIGLCFLECGLELLTVGTTAGFIQAAVNEVEDAVAGAVEEVRSAVRSTADEFRANADTSPAGTADSADGAAGAADDAGSAE